ncbi:hypothetical protein ABZP36_008032 [Zizania latifolia]
MGRDGASIPRAPHRTPAEPATYARAATTRRDRLKQATGDRDPTPVPNHRFSLAPAGRSYRRDVARVRQSARLKRAHHPCSADNAQCIIPLLFSLLFFFAAAAIFIPQLAVSSRWLAPTRPVPDAGCGRLTARWESLVLRVLAEEIARAARAACAHAHAARGPRESGADYSEREQEPVRDPEGVSGRHIGLWNPEAGLIAALDQRWSATRDRHRLTATTRS